MMKKVSSTVAATIVAAILLLGVYYGLFLNQETTVMNIPGLWPRYDSAIQKFFYPAKSFQNQIDRRKQTKLWRDLCDDWKAIYPEESTAGFSIEEHNGHFFISPKTAFPYLDEEGNQLFLGHGSASANSTTYSLILYPRDGKILIAVHEIIHSQGPDPFSSPPALAEFLFER